MLVGRLGWLFLLTINVVFAFDLKARGDLSEDNFITIQGTVNCVNPINGILASVSIYNISQDWGTITRSNGEFEIRMAKEDTVVFFTEAHKDHYYFIGPTQEFKDHNISVFMEPDAIWMETVEIIGISTLEEFKMEILNMQVSDYKISTIKPDLNKYAKEQSTGKPMPVLLGPLNYLQEKFSKQDRMKKKIRIEK